MKAEVIGPGCPFCKTLCKRVKEVVRENNMEAEVQLRRKYWESPWKWPLPEKRWKV